MPHRHGWSVAEPGVHAIAGIARHVFPAVFAGSDIVGLVNRGTFYLTLASGIVGS
jgi:hypothetical protein